MNYYLLPIGTQDRVAILPLKIIPNSFIRQIEDCMVYFTDLQIKAIKENLSLYPLENKEIIEKLNDLKAACADAYVQKYGVFSSSIYDASKLFHRKKVCIYF